MAENPEDVGILDNRAATYCSLKQYSQARADSRNMIKLAPDEDRVSADLSAFLAICTQNAEPFVMDLYFHGISILTLILAVSKDPTF